MKTISTQENNYNWFWQRWLASMKKKTKKQKTLNCFEKLINETHTYSVTINSNWGNYTKEMKTLYPQNTVHRCSEAFYSLLEVETMQSLNLIPTVNIQPWNTALQ